MNLFLMNEVELPLIPIVAAMEEAGYAIDTEFFHNLRARLEPETAKAIVEVRKVAGPSFNPASPKQLQALLFTKLGLKPLKQTKTGQPSTDDESLRSLAKQHEIIPHLLRLRALQKVVSTYCSIPEIVDCDGRLHVEFNQLAAETGRFASSSIIQTLPKNDGFHLRDGFIAAPGCQLVGADFRQQELNLLAQISGDKNMLDAIQTGVDLHGLAAVKVFKLDCQPNEVEVRHKDKRDQVKTIQFGLIYGKSAYSVGRDLEIPVKAAETLIADYFNQFPAVKRLIDRVHHDVASNGYIDDVFGRRRYLPDATSSLPKREFFRLSDAEKKLVRGVEGAMRQAQNFIIQGAAATVTKLAMIRCHRHIAAHMPTVRMILTLHDEIQFEVPDDLVALFAGELPGLMCNLGWSGLA